jgi:hypothetical protein
MKISKSYNLLVLILLLLNDIAFSQPGSYYPPPSSVNYQPDTLIIYPPDSLPGPPAELQSYNIFVDGEFYDNAQVADPEEVVHFFLDQETLLPGSRIFCVAAVYNEWISDQACDTATIIYGYELPFYEDWSSGSFETLQWHTSSDHWVIETDNGNPAPDVAFVGEPGLVNYEASLESYPINAVGMYEGKIWLDFDLKLQSVNSTNKEELMVQVWKHSSQSWTTCAEFFNAEGNFGWETEHINIKSQAMNKVFKIRFLATGENSQDISAWEIDNIHVYRRCDAPTNLELTENTECNELDWAGLDGCGPWDLRWDDGMNSGNSIGTGSAVEFDVAAKWTTQQLSDYNGSTIYKIAFFPAENQAIYSVRVWTGSGPDTLIIDQLVTNPVIGAWNYIYLNDPFFIDASKALWIGYHISTQAGYPAGVDYGPARNGSGNMIYFDGIWQTLLEINPDLDFNWNIAGLIYYNPYGDNLSFNIYRSSNQGDFELYDVAHATVYKDNDIDLPDYYCYKVTAVWTDMADTCESNPTNIACEVDMLGTDPPDNVVDMKVYPNPASSYLKIESSEKISEVRIYNMLGECELKVEIGNSEGQVDVRGLSNGIYFVEAIAGDKIWKDKVLIIR